MRVCVYSCKRTQDILLHPTCNDWCNDWFPLKLSAIWLGLKPFLQKPWMTPLLKVPTCLYHFCFIHDRILVLFTLACVQALFSQYDCQAKMNYNTIMMCSNVILEVSFGIDFIIVCYLSSRNVDFSKKETNKLFHP